MTIEEIEQAVLKGSMTAEQAFIEMMYCREDYIENIFNNAISSVRECENLNGRVRIDEVVGSICNKKRDLINQQLETNYKHEMDEQQIKELDDFLLCLDADARAIWNRASEPYNLETQESK